MSFLSKLFKTKSSPQRSNQTSTEENSKSRFEDVESVIYPYFKQLITTNKESHPLPEDFLQIDKSLVYHLPKEKIIIKNICADLNCLYAIDKDHGYEIITDEHLSNWGIDEATLHETALGNFRNLMYNGLKIHGDSNGIMFTLNGNLEAGLVLIDEVWTQLEEQIGEPVVTAIPARDVVVATGKSNRAMIDDFKQRAIDILTTGDHPLSKNWFIKSEEGWAVFEKIID